MSSRHLLLGSSAAALLLLALVIPGCVGGPRPWVENGVKRGTIHVRHEPGGKRWEYRDRSGRARRVEHRTNSGTLRTGVPVEHYDHDARGRVVQLALTDARGKPTLGAAGFAVIKARFEAGERGERLTHHEHYDTSGAALAIPDGYFRESFTYSARGKLVRRQYFDLDDQRVPVRRGRHDGVHEIRYAYLKGVTPVIMETLFDAQGKPIHKRQISGYTSLRVANRIDVTGHDRYYE